MNVSYVAGHLISVRDRMIVASPFNPDGDHEAGEPVILGGPVDTATRGSAAFAVSDSLLVYQPVQAETTTRLLWYDRAGANISQLVDDAGYSNLELSPDGSQLLVGILDPAVRTRDIWVVDLKRGVRSRLTSDPRLDERSAVWGRDNASFVYRGENRDLFRRPIGAGAAQPFIVDGRSKDPRMFSTDGKYFIYRVSGEGTSNDIWVKPLDPEGPPRALIASVFNESYADVSPDGRWIVYVSDESGQEDVYVTGFPSGAGKWRVSPAGGSVPRWSHDGREVFYLNAERVLMHAAVRPSVAAFDFDAPSPLFQTNADRGPGPQFIVTNDGKRFLVNSEIAVGAPESLAVVTNWQALLKKK
jgi:Tol biopolymer transport system component